MLNLFVQEYIGICKFLQKKGAVHRRNFFQIEKSELETMLRKNLYAEPQQKLLVWRSLQWLVCEEERFTVRVVTEGKAYRAVIFRLDVFQALLELTGERKD